VSDLSLDPRNSTQRSGRLLCALYLDGAWRLQTGYAPGESNCHGGKCTAI
jgi:hypothetical protein